MSLATVLGEGFLHDGPVPPERFEAERRQELRRLENSTQPEAWWRSDEEIVELLRRVGGPVTAALVKPSNNPHSLSSGTQAVEQAAQRIEPRVAFSSADADGAEDPYRD